MTRTNFSALTFTHTLLATADPRQVAVTSSQRACSSALSRVSAACFAAAEMAGLRSIRAASAAPS